MMDCNSYLLYVSFGCRLFITFCCCLKELTKRSEKKNWQQQMRSMEQCWVVQLIKLIEIKVSSEECMYDLSDCIFFSGESFSGNKSNKFKKELLIKNASIGMLFCKQRRKRKYSQFGSYLKWKDASGCNWEAVRFCLSSNRALVKNFLSRWNKL